MLINSNFYVISGGPGSGKTTVLQELEKLGFAQAPEVARQIIREQAITGGAALPWHDRESYTQLMLDRSIQSYRQRFPSSNITFFDRGIPDTLCYARLIRLPDTRLIETACREYRYAQIVFLAPPWKEIYTTDTERKQDGEEAERTFEQMVRVYHDCGYESAILPKSPPSVRAEFIVSHLRQD